MGWKPVGFSEIEKFPSQVLAHHYPQVTNFGDMTKYKEWQINDSIGLLVGGTPCQSFSVAGLRKGLEDPRGNLALTYVGILDHFRPKWFIWENVPGVLSSGGGRDFGSFLGALGELGYGWSYRVLDAQNFGVAQRRRRVFVVGYLGDWKPAAEILFESESLSGDIKQSRKARQETANSFIPSVVGTLDTECGGGRKAHQSVVSGHFIPTFWYGGQTAECLTAQGDDPRMPDKNRFQAVLQNTAVRRLTEVECERLQGFPDNYTNIKENCPSGVRYKALGNSMAVPVMRWIGERINSYETMRSSAVMQVETGVGLAKV
jgi:DNA (cytosine-5)-methyltransferase 1